MVKPGYKQTEIGTFPIEWNITAFKNVANVYRGGSPRPIQIYLTNSDEGINWIKIGDVAAEEKFISKTEEKIIAEGVSRSRKVGAGDFLLSNSMSFGRPYILSIEGCIHDGWLVIQDYQKSYDKDYLYYLLSSKLVIDQYISMAAGSSVKNLNKEKVLSLQVPVPEITEQKHIATMLSDIDELITSLGKQILKKKAIKQGAMQELLTGQKRLHGFTGEWKSFNLSKNSKIKARIGWQGLKKSEYRNSGYAYLVTGTDFEGGRISWNQCHFVTKERYSQDANIQIQDDDVLITKDGSLGKVALVTGLHRPATLNSGIFVIRPNSDVLDSKFAYYILSSFVFKEFLDKLSAGSTIVHLYQKDIGKFAFMIPPTKEEQIAISNILFDMDAEIESLEKKLQKAQQLKQGMMQQLLTGKIRLV